MQLIITILTFVLFSAVALAPAVVCAQAKPPPPVPPIEKIDVDTLQTAVKAAIACGASYLVHAEETNQCGYLYPPTYRSNIVSYSGFKEDVRRYRVVIKECRKITYEVPVWKPIYESYETFAVGAGASGADARNLGKVTKQRVIGREQTGTATATQILYEASQALATNQKVIGMVTITQTVADVNGPIAVTNKTPIDPVWERKIFWPDGLLGMNGLGMYALIKCGYYEKTNIVQTVARNVANYMEYYGLPDMTWDVAWLAAAFANIPDPVFADTRNKLLNKLLDGQIVEGPSRGMWGPVCIRADTLAAMLAYEQTLGRTVGKAKGKAQGKAAAKAGGKVLGDMANEAEDLLKDFQKSYLLFAQQGLRFENVMATFITGSPDETITMMGLPYYIYDQAVADMESTALALFAIREAAENKCLPDKTVKPVGARKKSLVEPESTPAILARSAAAITGMQKAEGVWDECNIHQAISAFIPFGFAARTVDNVWQLESPATYLGSVQALAALVDLGHVVGNDRLLGKYGKNVDAGYDDAVKKLQNFLDNPGRKEGIGRLVPPYDLAAKSGVLLRGGALFGDNRRDLWIRTAYFLINQQKDDGSWQAPDTVMLSSGLLALWDEGQRRAHAAANASLPEDKRVPFNRDRQRAPLVTSLRLLNGTYLSTAFSMLALLEGVREPVAGFYSEKAETVIPPVLVESLNTMARENDLKIAPLRASPKTQAGIILRLPVLMLDGAQVPASEASKALITRYAAGTGFLVIERPGTADAEFETRWASLIGGKAGNVPESIDFVKSINLKLNLRGIYGANGQLTAVFLPQVTGANGRPIADSRVMIVLSAIIRSYAEKSYFDRDYALKIRGFSGEPFVARVALLDQMNLAAREVPKPLPDRATASVVQKTPETAVPVVPTVKPPPPEEESLETTESGIPIPKTRDSGAPKADEVW